MTCLLCCRGVDVVPLLQWLGASEKMIAPFTKTGVGYAAVAYLLYKLATPLRYTVTIGGTHLSVRYLRRWGYLPPIASTDTIRSMVKTKIGEVRDQQSHRQRSRSRKCRHWRWRILFFRHVTLLLLCSLCCYVSRSLMKWTYGCFLLCGK